MSAPSSRPDLLELVVGIVSAHVGHNAVTPEALPSVIRSVCATLNGLTADMPPAEQREPAAPIKTSVFPDYLVCLEDGRKLKMLKRHLSVAYGLTPAEYRTRWDLPHDYPMVAPNYAVLRSALAKTIGLGRKPVAAVAPIAPPVTRVAEGVRSRRAVRKATA